MMEDEKAVDVASLIHLAIQNKNNLLDFLDYAYVLFSSVDDEEKTDRLREIISNHKFQRAINKLLSLKEDVETKINYFGDDIGDQLDYDEEIETELINIKLEIFDYIGGLINELNAEEEFDI